jgi:alcohol dehydrogenase class IV
MRFDFATAGRILFGRGSVKEVAPAAKEMGSRALAVVGTATHLAARLLRMLEAGGLECVPFVVLSEPSVDLVRAGVALARREGCGLVISFGGGSAIDAGKAVAALLSNGGDPLDYLEVVGRGLPITKPSAPLIAVPTTAGTGAEVTRNAVLASTEHKVKASLRSAFMLPRLAVVDPELTLDLPRAITASTGLDALTQLIEPYVSIHANAMTDMFALDGMRRAARSLVRAFENVADLDARTDMAMASLLGGLCLANAGLGAVHGFAAPIGGLFDAPHGAVCAALLPLVMETNIGALRSRAPDGEALRRYQTVAAVLTGKPKAAAEDGARFATELCRRLNIPPLSAHGIRTEDVADLVDKASKASSMKGNPIVLSEEELSGILKWAIAG